VECLQCGTSNPEEARYCKACGTKIANQVWMKSSFHFQVLLIAASMVFFFVGVFLVSGVKNDELIDLARGASIPDYGPQAAAAIIEKYIPQAQWSVVRYPDDYARVQVSGNLNSKPIEISFMLNLSYREMYPISLVYDEKQYPQGMIDQKLFSMFNNQPLD
jgi:hypothetical protein